MLFLFTFFEVGFDAVKTSSLLANYIAWPYQKIPAEALPPAISKDVFFFSTLHPSFSTVGWAGVSR